MDTIKVAPVGYNITRPVWSVMIPVYNCASYLKKTLETVLSQDRGINNMEIWVVDDCSTKDDPKAIVDEIGKGRVEFFRQKENVGQLKNFETCLNLSKGKIIHLLHGDDYVQNGFYEKLEKPMIADSTIGAAFTRHSFVDENGGYFSSSEEISNTPGIVENFIYLIAGKQIIQTPSIVVKREVYENLGAFNKKLNWCEDWEMWIRIACNYKFYYEPANLAFYRLHKSSNTGNAHKTGRFVADVLKCINTYLVYLPIKGAERKTVVRKAKSHFIGYALNTSYALKDKFNSRTAISVLYKAFRLTYNFDTFFTVFKNIIKLSMPTGVKNYLKNLSYRN